MNSTLSSGCSSGLDALAQAMHFLSRDKANKALVIELAEEFSREAVCAGDKNVCLVLENSSSDKKPGYGRILAFESFFEKKGQRQGLNKALRLALEGCGLDHSELQDENCISEPYLFTIGQTLKLKPDKTTANMMFLALGQDNNSSCLIVKLPKPEEAKREP